MKIGDLVEAPECTGHYCGCVFCAGGSTNRVGLVIDHDTDGYGPARIDMYTVQFDFGEWRVHANEVNVVSR